MRKIHWFFGFISLTFFCLILLFTHASYKRELDREKLENLTRMVEKLELTDLCLFTDARYTRHPSMADLNTPFQDHPMAFEHFPSGSLLTVPPHLNPEHRKR